MNDATFLGIYAATISAFVVLLGLWVHHGSKISEFRQAWIVSLREELAAVLGHLSGIHGSFQVEPNNMKEAWKMSKENYVGFNEAMEKIKLRLNAGEKDSKVILDILVRLEKLFTPIPRPEKMMEIALLAEKLEESASLLLKKEWQRVQKGERANRFVLPIAILVLILGVASFVLYLTG